MAKLPPLGMPPIFRQTLSYVERLSDDEFSALMAVVEDLAPSLPTEKVLDRLGQVLRPGPGGSLTSLLEFAISTRRLTSRFQASVATIAAAVTEGYQASLQEPDTTHEEELRDRVTSLLNSRFISLRTKSITLSAEADLRLEDASSITDIRPVFPSDGRTDEVSGFVVIHTLKLDVTGSRENPLYITLDRDALVTLRDTIERAFEKDTQVSKLLSDFGAADLSIRSDA